MTSELECVQKLFSGTWKFNSDVKFEMSLRALKIHDEQIKYVAEGKTNIVIERRGDSIYFEIETRPSHKHRVTFRLGEDFVSKDEADPPFFHSKETATFENNALTIKARSLMEGLGKVPNST